MLPLAVIDGIPAASCVGSGYCCRQRPCPFGAPTSANDQSCRYLQALERRDDEHQRFTCGIADIIITRPGWELSPAFGAGCCSPVGNDDRSRILRDIGQSASPADVAVRHHSQNNQR